jgi:formate hydrogenlyase subunit 4
VNASLTPMQSSLISAGLALLQVAGFVFVAPLLKTIIKKMKARFQNRQGPPLLQGYYDLAKLLRKESVRSETASWVYAAGPRVYFAAAVAATTLVPVVVAAAPLEAAGGILLLVGTLALGRFALATAALDTGSPFGGMGASRDMTIAALAEPALMLGLFTSALAAGSLNLGVLVRALLQQGQSFHPSDFLAFAGLFVILIAETGRIPVDNPATHLELTMIHEAMVLEYAGPDLALVEWASAIKELLYMTVLVDLFVPIGIAPEIAPVPILIALAAWAGKLLALAVAVTVAESANAKLRLFRVPELVSISLGLGFLALAIRFL